MAASSSARISAQVEVVMPQLRAMSAEVRPAGAAERMARISTTRRVGGDFDVDVVTTIFLLCVQITEYIVLIVGELWRSTSVYGDQAQWD